MLTETVCFQANAYGPKRLHSTHVDALEEETEGLSHQIYLTLCRVIELRRTVDAFIDHEDDDEALAQLKRKGKLKKQQNNY